MWVSFLQICYITDVSTHSDSLTINYPIVLWDFGPTEGTTRGKIMPSGLKCSTIASGRVLSDSCIIQVFLPSKQLFALSFFFLLPMFFISLYSPMWYYQSLDSIQKSLLIINEIGNMNVICFLAIQWVSLAHVEYPQPVFCQVTFLYCWSLCFFPYYLKSLFFSCLFKFISCLEFAQLLASVGLSFVKIEEISAVIFSSTLSALLSFFFPSGSLMTRILDINYSP